MSETTKERNLDIFGHEVIKRLQQDLRRNTPLPRHAKVHAALRELIEAGELETGQLLPTLGQFSKVLLVAVVTVRTATERLVQQGYLTPKTSDGYQVKESRPDCRDDC